MDSQLFEEAAGSSGAQHAFSSEGVGKVGLESPIRKFRVAMVAACPFPANHGSPASIREMSEALSDMGHEVHIVTYPMREDISVNGPNIDRVSLPFLRKDKITIGPTWEKLLLNPLMILKLVRVIYKYKIDVIHAHNYEGALIGWFAKLLTGRPMLYNAVNSMTDELPTYDFFRSKKFALRLGEFLDRHIPGKGDFVTTVSDELKTFLMSQKIPEDRIQILPAGVNVDMFSNADRHIVRARHELGDAPLVVYTGALDSFQRIDYLLKGMRVVIDQEPRARLVLVNGVPNPAAVEEYRKMSETLDIADNVIFAEHVHLRELPAYLEAADVAVLPRPECPGHPVKLLNYMAAGKAVVSFQGAAKGLHHMHNGYLVENHDFNGLGQGIAFLLRDADCRRILGENARETAHAYFSWHTLVKGLVVIYDHLCNKNSVLDRASLQRFVKESYIPAYYERRDGEHDPNVTCRRSEERRKETLPIDYIERRRVIIG